MPLHPRAPEQSLAEHRRGGADVNRAPPAQGRAQAEQPSAPAQGQGVPIRRKGRVGVSRPRPPGAAEARLRAAAECALRHRHVAQLQARRRPPPAKGETTDASQRGIDRVLAPASPLSPSRPTSEGGAATDPRRNRSGAHERPQPFHSPTAVLGPPAQCPSCDDRIGESLQCKEVTAALLVPPQRQHPWPLHDAQERLKDVEEALRLPRGGAGAFGRATSIAV